MKSPLNDYLLHNTETPDWCLDTADSRTQPEMHKLEQASCHQADIRMHSHRLLQLDNNSITSLLTDLLQVVNCMQA